MMDIIERIDTSRFSIFVAYKPEYAEWGEYELTMIDIAGAKIVPLRGKWIFDLRGFIDLWVNLRKERIDILHNWDVLGVPARIIGKLAGAHIAEELANPPSIVMKNISLKHYLINKWTSIFVDGYVACSKGVLGKYLYKTPMYFKNKIRSVVPNCVDAPDLNSLQKSQRSIFEKYNLNHHDRIITNIGYFNEQKAQSDLLRAFQGVAQKSHNVKLIIVGWGRLENELKSMVRRLGIENRVVFTGKLVRTQIFEVLSITDLFVLSSHWEGFGIVLVEAMVMGKPVVSTETDGAREVVEDGKTGILVPIGELNIMTEIILELLEDPGKMNQMGEEGRKRAIHKFGCDKFIQRYEAFYEEIFIGKKKPYRNNE